MTVPLSVGRAALSVADATVVAVTVIGTIFRPQSPPEMLRRVAEIADASGVEELWLWEDCFDQGAIASAAGEDHARRIKCQATSRLSLCGELR